MVQFPRTTVINLFKLFQSSNLPAKSSKQKANGCQGSNNAFTDTIEREGIVAELIEGPYKKGRVYFDCTWWPAACECQIILLPGKAVRVIGIKGITLIVEPLGRA